MRQIPRDTWIALTLVIILVIVTALATVRQTEAEQPPLAVTSNQPDGARAFYLWLNEMDYTVSDERLETFDIPLGTDTVLILNPIEPITTGEWEILDQFVSDGGTLVLAGENFVLNQAVQNYDFRLTLLPTILPGEQQNPLWVEPAITGQVEAEARSYLLTERTDYIVHLASGEYPLTVSFEVGAGRVILSTVVTPFTNEALSNQNNAHYALNVVNAGGGAIWFDTWHHGLRLMPADEINGPTQFLVRTPAGRAIVYTLVLTYIALVLRGQRLGRPLVNERDLVRRSPMEYVDAIANLNYKAGHQRAIVAQYHHRLKRQIGRRYRLNPELPDDVFVDKLQQMNPGLDTSHLRQTLHQLSRNDLNDNEMLKAVRQAVEWLDKR